MRKITIVAAAIAALTSTIGMARDGTSDTTKRFVHEGRTYVYTTTAASKGRQVIEGRRYPTGESFRLVVSGDRVAGTSNGVPVSFRVADAAGAAAGIQTAAN